MKKEFTLTPEETINIVCDDRKTPYRTFASYA